MKYGIYYAYWEKEWGGQFVPYVEKCKRLGFDVLEVACGAVTGLIVAVVYLLIVF